MTTAENEIAWRQAIAETADPEQRDFLRAFHHSYPDLTVERSDGEWVIVGVGLREAPK